MSTIPSSMTGYVQSLSVQDLNTWKDMIANEEARRKTEIKDTYGEIFCKIIGVDKIYSLVIVSAKNLVIDDKYPSPVKPSLLNNNSAVRGMLESKRPFIAIKIDVLEPETKKVVNVVVEFVFKRYPCDGDGAKGADFENNYSTTKTKTEEGKERSSLLYTSGGMTVDQIQAVKDLLDGKEINAPADKYYWIRMSK